MYNNSNLTIITVVVLFNNHTKSFRLLISVYIDYLLSRYSCLCGECHINITSTTLFLNILRAYSVYRLLEYEVDISITHIQDLMSLLVQEILHFLL